MIALSLAMLIATPAQDTAPAPAAAPAKEKKVCRQMAPDTGSHFPGKRVCHTTSEWASVDAANADGADALSRQALRHGATGAP